MPDKIQAARDAVQALNRAIEILVAKSAGLLSEAERDEIDDAVPILKSKRDRLQAAINANDPSQLKAPTDGQVASITQVLQQLDNATAANLTVSAIVDGVTERSS